jgi:hypothetical protein
MSRNLTVRSLFRWLCPVLAVLLIVMLVTVPVFHRQSRVRPIQALSVALLVHEPVLAFNSFLPAGVPLEWLHESQYLGTYWTRAPNLA